MRTQLPKVSGVFAFGVHAGTGEIVVIAHDEANDTFAEFEIPKDFNDPERATTAARLAVMAPFN